MMDEISFEILDIFTPYQNDNPENFTMSSSLPILLILIPTE